VGVRSRDFDHKGIEQFFATGAKSGISSETWLTGSD